MIENSSICAVCRRNLYGRTPHKSTFEVFCAMSRGDLIEMLTALLITAELFMILLFLAKLYGGI